jgi:hypothetical protein
MKDKNGVELNLKDKVLTYSPEDRHQEIVGELIQFLGLNSICCAAYIYFPTVKQNGFCVTQVRFDRELEKIEAAVVVDKIKKLTPVINDHICPHCGNDRCSKSEVSCWICGGRL